MTDVGVRPVPTYRLAPQYRPLPGERTEGDGYTCAPYLDRLQARRDAILAECGPPRRPRGRDGRFRPDPWPMFCFTLLVVAMPSGDELTFEFLADVTGMASDVLRESLEFWIRQGLIVCEGRDQ